MHNTTTLLDSQKLQYLKASLKDDTAKLSSPVTTTDANYTVAPKMLRERYQNNRMILRAHVNAIAVQKPLSQETAKKLLETEEEQSLPLENMGKPVNQQDVFLEKLPAKYEISGNFQFLEQNLRPTTTLRNFLMPDARYWKQLFSQHRQLQLQHNPVLQLVRTVSLHSHHKAATTSTPQHSKSNASVAMAHTSYTSARSSRISLSLSERYLSSSKKFCFNCLKASHRQQDCRGPTCRQCNLKHTLLYLQSSRPTRSVNNTVEDNNPNLVAEEASVATTPSPPENQIITTSISQERPGNIFLQTAMIPILANAESTYCRALLDSGSQSNLITDNLVKRLGLPLQKHQKRIFGLGAKDEQHLQGTTDFLLTPKNETAIPVQTFVLSMLTYVLPSSKVSVTSWKQQTCRCFPVLLLNREVELSCCFCRLAGKQRYVKRYLCHRKSND